MMVGVCVRLSLVCLASHSLLFSSFSLPHQAEDEYMISDTDLYVTRYVSRGGSGVNPAAYVAGVVRGALCAAGFPARVTAHWVSAKSAGGGGGAAAAGGGGPPKMTILIKFDESVMEREAAAAAGR